jgi:Na+-translocating ferredoxin:NAD+ oxidoreductase RnfD subunit
MSAAAQEKRAAVASASESTPGPTAQAQAQAGAADWSRDLRLGGLRRFAFAITFLNVLGHFWLGFETSWAHPLVAVATAWSLEALLEWIDARANGRPARWREGNAIDFFLSAHISAMAVSMLLYPGGRLWPVVLATAVAVGSKVVLRFEVDGRMRHVLNPSNIGIATVLVLFPQVSIAPPYQFTEALSGYGNWLLPAVLIATGTFLNFRFTHRLPLIAAWLGGFVLQAALRSALLGTAFVPALVPMTGLAFLLFTFYMVTDPPTSPSSLKAQIAFGASVAAAYGLLMAFHIVFGLFFSLAIVCTVRGAWLWLHTRSRAGSLDLAPAGAVATQRHG